MTPSCITEVVECDFGIHWILVFLTQFPKNVVFTHLLTQSSFFQLCSESVLHYGFLDFSKNKKKVMKYRFKEQEDWPLQDPQDPLTIIDSVEIALVYNNEAECNIETTEVVRYVHFNRMLNRIIIDNNRREIEEIKNETYVVKDELNASQEEISNLKRDLKKIHQVINSRQGKPSQTLIPVNIPNYCCITGIELRGGSSWMEGNLFVDGKPVCDDHWDRYGNQNAEVVCRCVQCGSHTVY